MGIFLSFFYERIFGPSSTYFDLSYKRQKYSKREERISECVSDFVDELREIIHTHLLGKELRPVTAGDSEREDWIFKHMSDFDELHKIIDRQLLRHELRTLTIGDSKREDWIFKHMSDFDDELQNIIERLHRNELTTVTTLDSIWVERNKYMPAIEEDLELFTSQKLMPVTIRDSKWERRIYKHLSDFDDEMQKIIRSLLRKKLRTVTAGDCKREERISKCLYDFDEELKEITRKHLLIPELTTVTTLDLNLKEYVSDFDVISQDLLPRLRLILELRTVTARVRELLSMPLKATEIRVDEQQEEKVAEAVISSSRLSEESPAAANTDNNTAILDSFINPTNIELHLSCTENVDPIESGESTSELQDFTIPSLTSYPNPVFSPNWQTVKEFTNQGGQLQREKSEVVLHVPNGAVKPYVPVLIKGAISIDFQKVHSTLDLAADETIVSPVAEYDAGQNSFFEKPICILLPHFLPPSFCQDYVSVLRFHKDDDGKISTHKMSLLTTSKEEDFYDKCDGQNGFYFTKSGAICVLTHNFSGFLCTYCRTNVEFSPVHLSLYAICRQQERKNVKVCLIMWDKRLHMQDFETQVLTNQEREMKSIQKDKLSMITENVEVREVGAFMDIPESHKKTWIHTAIDDFPIAQTKNLGDVLCSCVNSIPVKIWWSLHDVPCECPTTYFKCSIKVGYINMTATRKTTDLFNFCNSPTKQIFEVDDLKPQSAETESPAYVDTRMHNQINHQKGCLHVYLEKAKYVNCSISPVNNGSENSNSSIKISR